MVLGNEKSQKRALGKEDANSTYKERKAASVMADDFHEIWYSDMDSWLDDFKN
jgi:hypothetical protein